MTMAKKSKYPSLRSFDWEQYESYAAWDGAWYTRGMSAVLCAYREQIIRNIFDEYPGRLVETWLRFKDPANWVN